MITKLGRGTTMGKNQIFNLPVQNGKSSVIFQAASVILQAAIFYLDVIEQAPEPTIKNLSRVSHITRGKFVFSLSKNFCEILCQFSNRRD